LKFGEIEELLDSLILVLDEVKVKFGNRTNFNQYYDEIRKKCERDVQGVIGKLVQEIKL